MKNLVTSSRLQPVLYLQNQRKQPILKWFRIAKQNILDAVSTVRANYTAAFAKKTLKPRISEILPSLNTEQISDEFPSLEENKEKTDFLFYLYIALYMRFPNKTSFACFTRFSEPVLYFFFLMEKNSLHL